MKHNLKLLNYLKMLGMGFRVRACVRACACRPTSVVLFNFGISH